MKESMRGEAASARSEAYSFKDTVRGGILDQCSWKSEQRKKYLTIVLGVKFKY